MPDTPTPPDRLLLTSWTVNTALAQGINWIETQLADPEAAVESLLPAKGVLEDLMAYQRDISNGLIRQLAGTTPTKEGSSMTKYLRNLPAYYKGVVAVLGGVVTVTAALLGLGDALPHAVSAVLVSVSASATAAGVFLVKNEALVDALTERLANLLDR